MTHLHKKKRSQTCWSIIILFYQNKWNHRFHWPNPINQSNKLQNVDFLLSRIEGDGDDNSNCSTVDASQILNLIVIFVCLFAISKYVGLPWFDICFQWNVLAVCDYLWAWWLWFQCVRFERTTLESCEWYIYVRT